MNDVVRVDRRHCNAFRERRKNIAVDRSGKLADNTLIDTDIGTLLISAVPIDCFNSVTDRFNSGVKFNGKLLGINDTLIHRIV